MDSKSKRNSQRKKVQCEGLPSLTQPQFHQATPMDSKRKSSVSTSKTNKRILPPVKNALPKYLPSLANSTQSHTNAGENIPSSYKGAVHTATVNNVKQPSDDKSHNEAARNYLSPQLIRNFPAESFAFLEQLSQMQRLNVKKILKMKYITNLELLQKSKTITNWVTIASRDVVLPAVYLYQAITKDLYKRYTQRDLHHKWLCLGDGWMSSAVNHEGVVSAANIFNALVCMTRTDRRKADDSDEGCVTYSTPCNPSLANCRRSYLLFSSHIRVRASELIRHVHQMLLRSHLGSIYLSQSWWTMMTPDLAAKKNTEFLVDLLFNFIVYAVKNLLESFLGLPHKVPCNSSSEWTLQSRPGVSSTVSSVEEGALKSLSEVLISRVADMLSATSETQQKSGDGLGRDSKSEDNAITTETVCEDPVIYDDYLEGYISILKMNGTPSQGLDSITTVSDQSLQSNTGLLKLCKNENGSVYQHPISPAPHFLDGRDCVEHIVVSGQTRPLRGFCLDQNSASSSSAQSISSCTSVSAHSYGCLADTHNLSSAEEVEQIEGSVDSHPLKEDRQTPYELSSPMRASVCGEHGYGELPGRVCSSGDLSQSNSTIARNSSMGSSHQPTLSPDTDAAGSTMVEETGSLKSHNDASITQEKPSLTSNHSLSSYHQQKCFESMEDTVNLQDNRLRREDLFKGTNNKIFPKGVVDTVVDNRRFCLPDESCEDERETH